jgi:amino acid adenylation domain-containing protein
LHHYFDAAAAFHGSNTFLVSGSENISYRKILEVAGGFQKTLLENGIQKHDRVIIYSAKNAASIAMMIACSKCDSLYVPVSSVNPAARAKFIIDETDAKFILCDESAGTALLKTGITLQRISSDGMVSLYGRTSRELPEAKASRGGFILFTSGSTGTPKGVVVSHSAARSFIDWAKNAFAISEKDVVASIAPFNFDLSVFDIYVTAHAGGKLILYSEEETGNALLMAQKLSIDKPTTIYATPTFYSALAHYGRMHKYEYDTLKNVLFAGEVFHPGSFKLLLNHWPGKKYTNMYGPTETNVCTFFHVDLTNLDYPSFPIGKGCEYANLLLADEQGKEITGFHNPGELWVAGDSLFTGYWNDPEKTGRSFHTGENRVRYYKTGDIVFRNEHHDFVYVSRKDRMIKKKGYRIEPLEIEKVMLKYPMVSHAAVFFVKEKNLLICCLESTVNREGDYIQLKEFCQKHLPLYMIPDKFVFLDSMPKTSSGKVDLQALYNKYL